MMNNDEVAAELAVFAVMVERLVTKLGYDYHVEGLAEYEQVKKYLETNVNPLIRNLVADKTPETTEEKIISLENRIKHLERKV